MVRASFRLIVGALLALLFSSLVLAEDAKTNYITLGKWPMHTIEVDKLSVSQIVDSDDDVLVGGTFRITMSSPLPIRTPAGLIFIKTFVNSVVAGCGSDGVILITSKTLDPAGKVIHERVAMTAYQDLKQESTPPTEMYKYLCSPETIKATKPKASSSGVVGKT